MTKEELLYHYFSNGLTTEQEKQFDELLENDIEFKKRFEFEQNLKHVIKKEKHVQLKALLNDVEDNLKQQNNSSKITFFNWKIAASIVVLLGLGWFGYNSFFSIDFDDLYSSNFQEYPNTVYTITRSGDENTLEREAFVAYETQNYQIAIDKFNAINESDKKDYFDFYIAQSYLKLDNIQNAKDLFKEVIVSNTQFVAEAHWYLALISIKEKDNANASMYLKKLISKYDYNKDKAIVLLDNKD
jgi:tetratricopeptide (TPR) repeat protein